VNDNIRPHIRALIERGKVTLEEYKELRCNSWEYEALVPALSIEALIWASKNCIRNCSRVSRPATTYDEAMHAVYGPELIRRLRLLQEERNPVLETAHNATFPCRFCGSKDPKDGCQACNL